MGTSRTPAELVGKINQLAATTEQNQRQAVIDGSQAAKTILLSTAAARGMRAGSKIAGKRWTVRYDLNPGVEPSSVVRFTGPFHLVENATKPHEITPKATRRQSKRGSSGARAIRIGDNVRSSASHPGTRGKHVFKVGKTLAGERVPKVMAGTVMRGLRDVFG